MRTFVVLNLMHMFYCSNCLSIADFAFIGHSATKQISLSTPELFQMGEVAVVCACVHACMHVCTCVCTHMSEGYVNHCSVVYVWPCVSYIV